jgi:hypothetical protein
MGKKPITINEPTPVTYNENNLKFDDIEDERVGEFDDLDEHVDEDVNNCSEKLIDNQMFSKRDSEIEKIVLVYSDKTFEIIVQKK